MSSQDRDSTTSSVSEASQLHGLLAEFDSPEALLKAAEKVRDAGFTRWDAHTPFPVHGLDAAMGIKPTVLPWLVLGGGVAGLGAAVLLQWWTNAVNYPYLISGKPYFSLPANIPIIFEVTVLLSAIVTFFGVMALNGLPKLYNPLFKSTRFARVTDDRFFIEIEAVDPKFNRQLTESLLTSLGAVSVETVEA